MRRYIILILSLITIITMTFAQEEISIAKDFVYLMSQGDYEKTVGYFDSSVSAVISSSLKEIWESLIKGVGNYEGIIEERTEESGNYKIIYLTTKFSNAYIDIKMVFLNKNIVGLFFLPAQIKSFNTPPPYVNLEAFEEKDLKIGKDFVLPGKLTIPKGEGPFPVVIFVHGSGPNDMDETIGPNKIFRDLAWGLSSFGIATLRYDKRTKVYPQEFSKYEDGFTVMEEVIEDVLYAIEFVKTQEEIDKSKIFILGHSLGGMLAPRIASLSKDVKGIIIMAGPTRPLEDLIWEQINYIANLDGKIDEKEKEQLELIKKEIEKLKDPEIATKYPLSMNILGAPVKYFLVFKKS